MLYHLLFDNSFDGSVASATLLVYDIALTFEQEVRRTVVTGSSSKLQTYNPHAEQVIRLVLPLSTQMRCRSTRCLTGIEQLVDAVVM